MDASPEPTYRVRFIGAFSLTDAAGCDLCPPGQKPRALLAYLLYFAGQPVTREKLIGVFWTDRGSKQGRDSLRQALHAIRSSLGEHADRLLEIERQSVRALADDLAIDLYNGPSIEWRAHGPFLEDLAQVSSGFESWVGDEARSIRSRQISAAEQYMADIDPAKDPDGALSCAEAILSLDPHNEAAARAAMTVYASGGKRGHALRVYENLRLSLEADDFEVSAETQALIKSISENSFPIATTPPEAPRPKVLVQRGIPAVRIEIVDSNGAPNPYLSDFADHLISRCVQMPELRLHTESDGADGMSYKTTVSLGQTNSGLRISLRLLAPDDQFIWSGRADLQTEPEDAEITLSVDRLVMQLLPALEEHVYFNLEDTWNSAYGCYLLAKRKFWTDPQAGYIYNVMEYLDRAIEIDPDFLPPYGMLVMYYNTGMFMSEPGVDHSANRERAYELSQKLLFLNSRHANAHISMGWCQLWRGNFDAAERSIRRAMELSPYEPHRLNVIGTALVYLGNHDEGKQYYDMAQERIQHDFDFQRTDYGELYFLKQDYHTALSWMEEPEVRAPYKTYYYRAATNALLSRPHHAQEDLDAFVEDIRTRWADASPFSPEAAVQWYTDMVPLRTAEDRQTLSDALAQLGFAVRLRGMA